MARGKCPKCGEVVTRASVEDVDIVRSGGGAQFVGASIFCPHCNTILGLSVDPLALKRDIVREVVKKLLEALKK
jgi:hypothetical protein